MRPKADRRIRLTDAFIDYTRAWKRRNRVSNRVLAAKLGRDTDPGRQFLTAMLLGYPRAETLLNILRIENLAEAVGWKKRTHEVVR